MVVFSSDNGYFWGEHGLGDKRWPYEESIRDPLLVRYPKLVKPGTTLDELVLNIDHVVVADAFPSPRADHPRPEGAGHARRQGSQPGGAGRVQGLVGVELSLIGDPSALIRPSAGWSTSTAISRATTCGLVNTRA